MTATNYIWDFATDSYLMEKDDGGTTTAVYTNEPVHYGGLISQRRGSETSHCHFDGQGSTRQLTDQSGDVTDDYKYSAFGESVSSSGTTANPFRYLGSRGYFYDSETLTYYVRARGFIPTLERWVSCDPLLWLDSRDGAYWYAMNSPLTFDDPSGLVEEMVPLTKAAYQDCFSKCVKKCWDEPSLSIEKKCGVWCARECREKLHLPQPEPPFSLDLKQANARTESSGCFRA